MASISFLDSTSTGSKEPGDNHIILGETFLYRRSLQSFLFLLMILILMQGLLNFAVNPAGLFHSSGFQLASIRSSDTYLKLNALDSFLERTTGSEITLALGSSRILLMSFSSEEEPDTFFFNAATSGGQPEDVLAFTRHILEHPDVRVSRVYINADPFFLSENTSYGVRLDGVYVLDQQIPSNSPRLEDLGHITRTLLSNDWARATVQHLRYDTFSPVYFDHSDGVRNENAVFAPQLARAGSREALLTPHIDRLIETAPSTEISRQRVEDLQTAVTLLVDHGAEVVLIFMPHQSLLWNGLTEDPNYRGQIIQTRQILTAIALSPQVTYCDFADPAILGLESDEYWWDGVHYTGDAADVIREGVTTCINTDLEAV